MQKLFMIHALYLIAFYLWLGFTVGYFFRKWLETRWVPSFRAARGDAVTLSPAGSAGDVAEERVEWIGEDGRALGRVTRREMRARNLLHRVTATLVFHPDGRLYVQRRSASKDVYPGKFDVCVGGTVAAGEDFATNALREVGEELGVRGVPVHPLFRHRFQDAFTNSLIQVSACVYDGPITLQPEEVSEGAWMDRQQVEALLELVCPDSARGFALYVERYGWGPDFARGVPQGLGEESG